MKITKVELRSFELTCQCPDCLEGQLQCYSITSGYDKSGNEFESYKHECTHCEFETVLQERFPRIDQEKLLTNITNCDIISKVTT